MRQPAGIAARRAIIGLIAEVDAVAPDMTVAADHALDRAWVAAERGERAACRASILAAAEEFCRGGQNAALALASEMLALARRI